VPTTPTHWYSQPDTIFKLVLWLLSPAYVWLAKLVWNKLREAYSSSSERNARRQILSLRQELANPPTLLGSVAYLVCFLPLPFALIGAWAILYLAPNPRELLPAPFLIDAKTGDFIVRSFFLLMSLTTYMLFGVLTIFGARVAYHLRHGEAKYVDNYRATIEAQIQRLKKKFPALEKL
jgi:hypothetical protein